MTFHRSPVPSLARENQEIKIWSSIHTVWYSHFHDDWKDKKTLFVHLCTQTLRANLEPLHSRSRVEFFLSGEEKSQSFFLVGKKKVNHDENESTVLFCIITSSSAIKNVQSRITSGSTVKSVFSRISSRGAVKNQFRGMFCQESVLAVLSRRSDPIRY